MCAQSPDRVEAGDLCVESALSATDFTFYNERGQLATEAGAFQVWVAPDLASRWRGDFRGTQQVAPRPSVSCCPCCIMVGLTGGMVMDDAVGSSGSADSPAATAPVAEPIAVRRRKREFAALYSKWQTQQLERALGEDRRLYDPLALAVMLQELERRQCPACCLPRKLESPRCDCGHHFLPPPPPDAPDVATDPVAEFSARLRETADESHFQASRSIESAVQLALVAGCVSLLVAILWSAIEVLLVCATAIGAAIRVKWLLAVHRDYLGAESARRRARIGQILAWIAAGLNLLSLTGLYIPLIG